MIRLRRAVVALGVALALLGVSGCGSSTELGADRARTLQASVLAVTRAAADGHWREATTLLGSTRALLDAGVEQGEVSAMRYRAIDAALDEVEAELAAAQERSAATETAPAVEATPTQQATTKVVVEETKAPSKPEPARPGPAPEPKKPKKPKEPTKVEPPDKPGPDKGKKGPGDRTRG